MVILHITHTDISRDIRILKELEALGTSFQKTAKIIGIGLKSDSGPTHATSLNGVELKAIAIPFINKKYLKGTIKHILTFLVLLFSMLFFGLKYRPQIVHCHDTMVLPVGLILKIVLRCKLIYDAHELESERNGISKIASIYTRTLEKIGWQYIDLLIAVSPSIIAWYQENYGMKTNRLILNSPDFQARPIRKKSTELGKLFSIPKDIPVFVYVGAIGNGRGIELLLNSFSDTRVNAHLVFIGWGELVETVQSYEMKCDNIHYHPPVSHQELGKLLSGADVGLCLIENVSLSDYFAIPNKLLEYAFSGLLVLGSDFPEMSATINEYKLGLTTDLSQESVIQAIGQLEKQPRPRDTADLSALTWQTQANRLISGYQEFV